MLKLIKEKHAMTLLTRAPLVLHLEIKLSLTTLLELSRDVGSPFPQNTPAPR